MGGAGDDLLIAGGGDDLLVDGPGRDTMRGGPGADIFVFVSDGEPDRVENFELGIDRLDLSAFPGLYSVTSL
jgi:serralysin